MSAATLTIAASTVASTLTGFVVRVDLSHMPTSWWADVDSDGGNVVVSEGGVECPTDVVWIDTGAETGELFFKATLTTAAHTFLVDAPSGGPGPASGRAGVWSDYDAVLIGAVGGSLINRVDGTAATAVGSAATIDSDGKVNLGTARDRHYYVTGLAQRTAFTLGISTWSESNVSNHMAAFSYTTQSSTNSSQRVTVVDRYGSSRGLWNSSDAWREYGTVVASTHERRLVTLDGTTQALVYLNGALVLTDNTIAARPAGTPCDLALGASHRSSGSTPERWQGSLNYAYLRNGLLSAAWAAAEDASWRTPASFYTATEAVDPDPGEAAVYYRARVTVGAHEWTAEAGDHADPDYTGPTLPLSFGWDTPDSEPLPAIPNPVTATFGLTSTTPADLADVVLGTPVTIDLYTDPDPDADPWQHFDGVVTQLDATTSPGRTRYALYAADPMQLLTGMPVGAEAWPAEDVAARLARIAAEAGISLDADLVGLSGSMPARGAAVTTARAAVLETIRYGGIGVTSDAGKDFTFRVVPSYDPDTATLHLDQYPRLLTRWPALLTDTDDGWAPRLDPARVDGDTGGLHGAHVRTSGAWTRLPADRPGYVLVDGVARAGTGPWPRLVSTGLDPTAFGAGAAREDVAEFLAPGSGTAHAWRTDTIRHLSWLDPAAVAGWASWAPITWIQPVMVDPVADAYALSGLPYLAGTLAGARVTLAGGRYVVDLQLRPDLAGGEALHPTGHAAAVVDDLPAVDVDDLHPALTVHDLSLIGAP